MNKRDLNKLCEPNEEVTRYKGEYWLLHICKNDNPVPLFHAKNPKLVAKYIELRS